MRNFNIKEQDIIKQLTNKEFIDSNVLNFISENCLENRAVFFLHKEKTIQLIFNKQDSDAIDDFLIMVLLLSYLEKNHLILVHSKSDKAFTEDKQIISKKYNIEKDIHKNQEQYFCQNIQTNIYDLMANYAHSYFYVSEELRELVKNDFKTIEDIRHEKELSEMKTQTKLSRFSYCISIVALIISIFSIFKK